MPANVTTSDVITQQSIRETVNMAVEEQLVYGQIYRDIDIAGLPNDTIELPQDDDAMAEPGHVPENGHFPRDEEDTSTISATVDKFGLEIAISEEAEADSLLDVVQMQLNKRSRKMRELLNQHAFDELNDTNNQHPNTNISNSSDSVLGFDDVTEGLKELRASGYNPDMLIVGPQGERDILNDPDFNRADTEGANVVRQGVNSIGSFAGVEVVFDNDGHLSGTSDAFLVDTDEYGYFVHKGGIMTDEYEDPATRSRVFQIFSRHVYKAEDASAAIRINGDA